MKQFELGQDAPRGLAETADQVFVELQLVTRRLQRVERLIGSVAAGNGDGPSWSAMHGHCERALASVALAASVVPDALPEHELTARVVQVRDLRVESSSRRAWFAEAELPLSALEFGLLGVLAVDPMRVHTKAELLREIWGYRSAPRTRTVDSHASRLRRKLEDAGASPLEWVVNQRGVGYALLRPRPGRDVGGRR